MILSVSRRTDIPAFYSKWFMNRVREGFVYVRNPFNANQISRIPLGKDVVDCIVFWSKNPAPLMDFLPEIVERYEGAFYFQYTLNAYGRDIEPGLPEPGKRIETFRRLAEQYGPQKVVWRYDPVLLTENYSVQWHVKSFESLFRELKDHTDTCVISFIDMYDKTVKNTRPYGIAAPSKAEMELLAEAFSEIAKGSGVVIRTCAESGDFSKYGITPNRCIDRERIEAIIGCPLKAKPDHQRDHCQCIECADIGIYNTCLHGCRYCYANFNEAQVRRAVAEHDPHSPLLSGHISDTCVIKNYSKAKSLKGNSLSDMQMKLF